MKVKYLINNINPLYIYFLFFFSLILLITFWRLIFFLNQLDNINTTDYFLYLKSFIVSIRLDAVVISYFCLPIFLSIYLPYIGWSSNIYKKLLKIYLFIVIFLYSLLSIIDIEFFKEFGTHLNLLSVQSNAKSNEIKTFIFNEYPVILYLSIISIISFFWLKLTNNFILNCQNKYKFKNNFIFFIITLIFLGTTIRGGWQKRPIDWGHAMFSNNQLANQLALNPMFNLARSIIQLHSEKNISKSIQYMDRDVSFEKLKNMIITKNEYYIDDNSLKRKIYDPKSINPNIVIFVLESFLGNYCGFLNHNYYDVTPNLNLIADKGLNFTRAIASGKRSAYGLGSILSSYPALPGYPIISQLESQNNIETIASLLKKTNYSTFFMYGGDADFDNMKGFLISNGFDKVIEKKNFPINTPSTTWGVFDEYLLNYASNILDTIKAPTLLTLFTTTNHQPWTIPPDKENIIPNFSYENVNNNILRTMAYTDYVIGNFIKENQTKNWFKNTIFIFISDHGINHFNKMFEDPRNAHIPFLIYSPNFIKINKNINTICSQVDLVPTLLHLIGYPYTFEIIGSNILTKSDNKFACRIINDYCIWFDKNFIYTEIFNQTNKLSQSNDLYNYPYIKISDTSSYYNKIQTRFHAYLQGSYNYFKKK